MFKILKKEQLSEVVYSMELEAPLIAETCQPGQFVIVMADEKSERIPLTIADYDREKGTVTVVVQAVGDSTKKLGCFEEGSSVRDVLGPLGQPSDLCDKSVEELNAMKIVLVGGGLGIAPVYPQAKMIHAMGAHCDVIMGARTKDLVFWIDKMKAVADNVYFATDDGSLGIKGFVTDRLEKLVKEEGKEYGHVVVIGPMIMMRNMCRLTAEDRLNIPTIASMNPVMVDGTGMCGACRIMVNSKVKFACVDGPEFDGHAVDWDTAMNRSHMYRTPEGRQLLNIWQKEAGRHHQIYAAEGPKDADGIAMDMTKRICVREQAPNERIENFDEVSYGYNEVEARLEATRCLDCKKPKCVDGCPVSIDIPGFIHQLKIGQYEKSFDILSQSTALPAVCGRVCPQETQCEGRCIRGIKGEPVAIGKLERYVADWARQNTYKAVVEKVEDRRQKVAVIGSGPSGIACAGDLAKKGYQVTVFESLHEAGGVLQYGIPEFRLPKNEVVAYEVGNLNDLGVEVRTDVFVGQTLTIPELMKEHGYEAVFIGTGAGLPRFMNIPGENLNGVYSANEYLTKNNLMHSYDKKYDTPAVEGRNVVTVGGGNVAMDAARTALRLGADSRIVYRRGKEELPARAEEVEHAEQEGVVFSLLCNPVRILGDDKGWVSGIECIKMKLGETDASGRARPIPVEGSEFVYSCDTVVMALGTNANPRAAKGLEDKLELNKWNGIVVDENQMTSIPGVFAGGDAVTGSATVILAMGAGRQAAAGIDKYLTEKRG